jgi:hypothetical protein
MTHKKFFKNKKESLQNLAIKLPLSISPKGEKENLSLISPEGERINCKYLKYGKREKS